MSLIFAGISGLYISFRAVLVLKMCEFRRDYQSCAESVTLESHWTCFDSEYLQAVLVTLAKEVELLSTSLKKAGWSVPDVTETMKVGLNAVW